MVAEVQDYLTVFSLSHMLQPFRREQLCVHQSEGRAQVSRGQPGIWPHWKAPVSSAQAVQPHPATLPLLLPQHLLGRSTGRGKEIGWRRDKERSRLPHARNEGGGGGGGEQRGGGAVRKLCVIAQSQCKPRGHFFSLCVLPSAWRVVIRMLHGSLWGADWEPSHHMVNKCGNRPTAERLLHVIKWQQPLP